MTQGAVRLTDLFVAKYNQMLTGAVKAVMVVRLGVQLTVLGALAGPVTITNF